MAKFFRRILSLFRSRKALVDSYLQDPERVQKTLIRAMDFIFQGKMSEILPEELPEHLPPPPRIHFSAEKRKAILEDFAWKGEDLNAISDLFTPETVQSAIELLTVPGYIPSEALLLQILNQSEIQSFLGENLESLLSEVNKKLNPFHGMFQKAGLEKQFSQMVQTFVPRVAERLAKLVHESPAGELGQEIMKNSIRILIQAHPKEFGLATDRTMQMFLDRSSAFTLQISQDPIVHKNAKRLYSSLREAICQTYHGFTLLEFLEWDPQEYETWKREVSLSAAKTISTHAGNERLQKLVLDTLGDIL